MSDKTQKETKSEEFTSLTFTRQKQIDTPHITPINTPPVGIELSTKQKAIQVNPTVPINQPVVKIKTATPVEIKIETEQK